MSRTTRKKWDHNGDYEYHLVEGREKTCRPHCEICGKSVQKKKDIRDQRRSAKPQIDE